MMEPTTLKPNDLPPEEDAQPLLIPGKKSLRLLAEMADMFLALIVGVFLYFGFSAAFGYYALTDEMVTTSEALRAEQLSAHLAYVNSDGTLTSKSELVEREITAIYDRTGEASSTDEDPVYLYYSTYRKAGLYSLADYNTQILGLPATLSEDNASTLFVYDTRAEEPLKALGILNSSTYANLQAYREKADRTQEALSAHEAVYSFCEKAYETAFVEFRESSPYLDEVYQYSSLVARRAYAATGGCLASYLVSASIFFLAIPLVKKKGTTIGKKVFKLEVRSPDGAPLKVWQILSRGAVELLEYVFEVPFEALLVFGFDTFALPLFVLGNTTVSLFVLAIAGLLITLVSTGFVYFSKTGQSFHDLASLTGVYTTDYAIIDAERSKRAKALDPEKNDE
jgi:uncharacterized RDD family membrane protein YckC